MSEDLERITILLQAKDKDLTRALDRMNKKIEASTRAGRNNVRKMNEDFDSHMAKMSKSVLGLGASFVKGLAVGAITTAFSAVTSNIRQTIVGIAEVGDEAKRSGLGLEAFQEWKYVAEQNRIGVDSLTDGFKELSLRADEFITTGAGSGAESFRRLGLTASDLKEKLKDPSELMLEIIGRLEGMDKAAQIRIADEVFGGTGGERFVELLSKGEAGIRSTIAAAHEAGAVLDAEMIAKADEIDKKWSSLTTKIGSWLKLVAISLADLPFDMFDTRINEIFGSEAQARSILGDQAFEELRAAVALTDQQADAAEGLRGIYQGIADDASQLSMELAGAASMADMLGNDDLWNVLASASNDMRDLEDHFAAGEISGDQFATSLEAVRSRAADALSQLSDIDKQGFSGVISNLGSIGDALTSLIPKALALKNALPGKPVSPTEKDDGHGFATGNADNAWTGTSLAPTTTPKPTSAPSNLDFDWTGKNWGKGGGGKSSRSSDNFANQMDKFKEETAALIAEAEALNNAALGFDEYGIAQDVARRKAELLQAAQNAGKKITPELTTEIDALAESYADAALRAEEARKRHDEFNSALDGMKGTMSNAFEGLVTGAMSFKDALRSVIAQLAAMAAQRAFSALWTGGLGASTGGILSGLFGFSSGGYTGPGGRNEVAGIAHKGEVVFSQDDVRRAGGVAAVEAARRSGMATAQPARSTVAQPQPQATQVYVTPSPYFDARVSEISGYGDAVVSRAQRQAMPGMIRDAQARGLL